MAAGIFRKLTYVLDGLLILLILWSSWHAPLVIYGIDQARGQLHIVTNSRDIDEVMADAAVPDSVKTKLRLIAAIKQFAMDSLGLKETDNYTTFYDQQSRPILWVLTASDRFALHAFEWEFPFLGRVSYKGFFDYRKGRLAEQELKNLGYDTDLDDVSAWSTLGFFKDPVLSGMLNRPEGSLAELLIHEMTHGTLYLPSSVTFNENFASVIGEEGAKQYLRAHGKEEQWQSYINRLEDYDIYSKYMIHSAARLDSLYASLQGTDWEKEKKKRAMMESIAHGVTSLQFHSPQKFNSIFSEALPNNTYFLSFRRYDEQKDSLRKELYTRFNGNIRAYISYMRKAR